MTDQNTLNGKCGECGHVWVVAYLPMSITKVSYVAKRAACPRCGCGKVFVAQGGAA